MIKIFLSFVFIFQASTPKNGIATRAPFSVLSFENKNNNKQQNVKEKTGKYKWTNS